MSEHVENLLALRKPEEDTNEARAQGEWLYRRQVMRLLGAEPVPGLDPPSMVRKLRRVEGLITVKEAERTTTGLVMFAEGQDGKGVAADIRAKDGSPAARSLLAMYPAADFILVITTGAPAPELLELAEAKSDLFYLGPELRRRIWVMGLPEVVARGEAFLVAHRPVVLARPWWKFWEPKLSQGGVAAGNLPASPLLFQ